MISSSATQVVSITSKNSNLAFGLKRFTVYTNDTNQNNNVTSHAPPSSPPAALNQNNMQNNIIDPPRSPLFHRNPHSHDAGRQVILPSSFMGSPRNMTEAYHDVMAIVRDLGTPDLFITFTCNENWPEIRENLKPD